MKKLLPILLLPFFAACSQIDTGNIGVESSLGQYKAEELPPGVYFTLFKNVVEVSAKENALAMQDLKPKSKDNLTMADFDFDIYFRIDPSKASELLMKYRGDLSEADKKDGSSMIGVNLITRQAREAAYKVAAEFNAGEMHTKRTELADGITKAMQKELDKDAGAAAFTITNVIVRNIVTDPALEASIKAAGQMQFQVDAKRKEVLLAEAEADRKRAEAKGEADAIKIKASAISAAGGEDYIRLQAIQKWDGKLPTTTGGAVPFINVK
jgi:regulator of protease activity HflC (stomatin/prohibitin superfamily)